uniref:dTMP kinase n=1 Tax=Salinibacter altiplanensis TaxID=1803181 RepID=UPI000C9EEFD2|nr:hypothetical protein [Salinibacter altiplanensis]
MSRDGHLIAIEGANEVGKTTLAHCLAESFLERGESCRVFAFPGNDAGTLGSLVKRIHENPPSFDVQDIEPTSLQLLHVAAHIDAIEGRIRPLLKEGTNIILDRFWWSTLVYGRVSGIDKGVLEEMIDLEQKYWDGIFPEKVFLIDREVPLNSDADRDSWDQIRNEYLNFAESDEHSYPVEIISNDASVEEVVERLRSSVDSVLGRARST